MNNYGGIYTITNTINNKQYIGSSINLRVRIWGHKYKLIHGTHHNPHLLASFNKYGQNAFTFQAVLYCEPFELLRYEQALIDTYKPEYNMCLVAGNRLGTKHSMEVRHKLSIIHKNNQEEVERLRKWGKSHKGIKTPREIVAKIVAAHEGKKLSEETKTKISKAHKGRLFTKEHRQKLSDAHKGIKQSEESRQKKSEKLKGIPRGPYSAERCHNVSLGQKGKPKKPFTKEHCQNLSKARKEWWAKKSQRKVAD